MTGDPDSEAAPARPPVDRGGADRPAATSAAPLDPTLPGSSERRLASPLSSLDATLPSTPPGGAVVPERDRLPVVPREHYQIAAEIARGSMGRVLEARDLRLDRPVAIKELLVGGPDLRARFEREARITARLQHPAIVAVHEAGTWPGGQPFFTMKKVAGRPLDAAIAAARTLAERLALLPHLLDVAHALAYAHGQGVIHRDLKPANVLVGEYGETVVIDWGLAKDLRATGGERPPLESLSGRRGLAGDATVAGDVLGTPMFMAPEQARGEPVDPRADVYALGAILYHLLAGVPPYRARTATELLARVKAGPPAPLASRQRDLPPDLLAIVAKAMARDPADRYPSAKELAEDLARFQTGQLVAVHHYTAGQLARRFVRRHLGAVTVAAVALLVLAIVAGYSLRRVYRAERIAEQEERTAEEKAAVLEEERGAEDLRDVRARSSLGYAAAQRVLRDPSHELHEALRDETDACHHGDLEGCQLLGTMYDLGQGVAQDAGAARTLYDRACEGADAAACGDLGTLYVAGRGAARDLGKARALFEQACDGGDANGCRNLARLYERGPATARDYVQARVLYRKACAMGNANACSGLGSLFDRGLGGARSYADARALYQRACDGGDAEGCSNLGYLYYAGLGGARDDDQALALFDRSCQGGAPDGCGNFGEMVRDGQGTSKDPAKAALLFQKSCAGGHPEGCEDLASLYRLGLGVAKNPAKAKALLARACRDGLKADCGP